MNDYFVELVHKGHSVICVYAYGDNDQWYWDKEYHLIIDGKPYLFIDIGSCSGYIPTYQSLAQVELNYLSERVRENTKPYFKMKPKDFMYDYETFIDLFDFMLEKNASEVQRKNNYKMEVV